jgi:hypothetical protein
MFALAVEQRINVAKSCVVPLGTLPPPLLLRWLVWAPSRLRHPRSAWASPSPQLLPKSFEPVGREMLRRQWRQPALGRPSQSSAAWDNRLASVELLCSRLLGLDLSAMGRGLGTTGYA